MRLVQPTTSCTYLTMIWRISYASTNLLARNPTFTNLPAHSPTSTNLSAHNRTHSITKLPARKTLKCEHIIYEPPRSYSHTRVSPIQTSPSILIVRSNPITNLPTHNTFKNILDSRSSHLRMQNIQSAQHIFILERVASRPD